MRLLITGGAGFIGSNFIRHLLANHPEYRIANFDKLTYAGNLDNLRDIDGHANYQFIRGDICDRKALDAAIAGADTVINFAAESHVDRSIESAADFIETNVLGTQTLLDAARTARVSRFVQISTDEVMGSCPDEDYFTEASSMQPNSPYAASKAAAEHLVRAAHVTFGFDVVTTRLSATPKDFRVDAGDGNARQHSSGVDTIECERAEEREGDDEQDPARADDDAARQDSQPRQTRGSLFRY